MRKKFTMLLASLFACMGVMQAQVPTASTAPADGEWAADTKWYTLKGDGGKYVSLKNVDANGNFKLNNTANPGLEGLWCVVGNETDGYQFYNYKAGTSKIFGATGSEANGRMKMYEANAVDGVVTRFDFATIESKDYVFLKNHSSANDWWNQRGGYLAYWNTSNAYSDGCTGSQYVFTEIVDFADFVGIAGLKNSAKTNLEGLKNVTALFTEDALDAAIAEINAVNATSLEEVEAALETLDNILGSVYEEANNKYVRFTTFGRKTNEGGVDLTAVAAGGSETNNSGDAGIWQMLYDEAYGGLKMYNFVSNLYLGTTTGQSQRVSTCADFADATPYRMNGLADGKTNLLNNASLLNAGNTLHANGWGNVVQWNDNSSEASIWKVIACDPVVVTREQYEAAAAAKASLPYGIQQAYGLVKDAAKFSSNAQHPSEGTFAGLLDNTYNDPSYFHSRYNHNVGEYHYLQAELSEEGTEFYFYFKKRQGNNNNRPTEIDVMGSSDGQTFTLIEKINTGLPTNANDIDYISTKITAAENVKHLRFVVKNTNTPNSLDANDGHPFFTFSEFYVFPATPDVTELVNSYGAFATLSITSEDFATAATGLINAETTLALANIKKDIAALLEANESNHNETPALGQYTTDGYNALNAAYKATGATQESLEEAIAAFKASKNRPVFTITGVKDYVVGKSIYDNNSGTLYFKATNLYDKSMWWAFDQTATTVGVTEEVAVTNVATGRGFWGAEAIKVTETDPANTEDNIFLFYTKGNGTPVHFQNDNQQIVRWNSKDAASGSATIFNYIGNSYDLSKLTDEQLAAAAELKAVQSAKYHLYYAQVGTGLGQYQGNLEALQEAIVVGGGMVGLSLTELAKYDAEYIKGRTKALNDVVLTINQPVEGRYYRIKGANDQATLAGYYITGHTNSDGGRIALTADADASTIYYYKDGKLQAYNSGKYIGLNSGYYKFADDNHPASDITFAGSSYIAGAYTIKSADRYLHYKVVNNTVEIDRCENEGHANDSWYLEEYVPQTYKVEVSNVGYSTYYSEFKLAIPESVTAYVVEGVENGEVNLKVVSGVLPANTGVILYGEGEHEFTFTADEAAAIETNLLKGTATKTLIKAEANTKYYMLAKVNDKVGLYKVKVGKGADGKDAEEGTHFYNNANKAYLPITVEPTEEAPAMFSFGRGEGTTGIESVEAGEELVIYDLAGRRVQKMEKGIYIVNGKKVVVK